MPPEQYARYDYAWKTPGFTAQNAESNIVYGTDGYASPGMPSDVTMVRVFYGAMEMDTGRSLEGVLRLRTDKIITHVPTGNQIIGGPLKPIRFKKDGFSIYLPATDDPQLSPEFTYHARLTVRGVKQEFSFLLPMSSPEVNLSLLIPNADESAPSGDNYNDYLDGGTP